MTLDEYLSRPETPTATEFARLVGVSAACISRVRRGEQNSTRDLMLRIIAASGGRVTAAGLVHNQSTPAEVAA